MNRPVRFILNFSLPIIFCFFQYNAFGQAEQQLSATPAERKEVVKTIAGYLKIIQAAADSNITADGRLKIDNAIKDYISSKEIFVYNDLDTLSRTAELVTLSQYLKNVSEVARGKLSFSIDTNKILLNKIKYDRVRKYNYLEALISKTVTWTVITRKQPMDVTQSDSITYDTLYKRVLSKLNVHIKFDKENNISRNFKVFAISKPGSAPKLEPLPPLLTWWSTLEDEWRAILEKKMKFEGYPSENDLKTLIKKTTLNVANTPIKNIEPLRKFTRLEKLDFSNTLVTSIDPIVKHKNITVLKFDNARVDTLKGLENLDSLHELRCSGNKLKGIVEVKNLSKLYELDCSNNEIEDISPIKGLLYLKELDFSLNIKIKDISAVTDLILLEKLALKKIDVRNLEALKGLVNLIYLDLFNTNITNLAPLKGMVKLMHLSLDHNKFSSLQDISHFKYITNLTLSSSSVKDLSAINGYSNLETIDISNTELVDLGPLHRMEYIKVLKAVDSRINKEEIQRFKKNHPQCQITYY